MVGRTPEFLGKKVEAREMKIATIVALAHPFVILIGTAVACYYWVYNPAFVEAEGGWLNNPGFHGFSGDAFTNIRRLRQTTGRDLKDWAIIPISGTSRLVWH